MGQPEKLRDLRDLSVLVFNSGFIATSETFIYRQIRALSTRFTVSLLGYSLTNTDSFDLSGLSFIRINKHIGILERGIRFLLRRIFKIHFVYPWKTMWAFRRYFIKRNVVVHAHYGWNGVYLLAVLKKYDVPLVVSFHGNDASQRLNRPEYKASLPGLFDYASHIVLCSDHMIDKLGLAKDLNKVSVIPYGIDVNEFKPMPYVRETAVIKILHTGRLVAKKGVKDVINVFGELRSKYPHIALQIVGDGIERMDCESRVRELNLTDSVTFYGALPQPGVKKLMNACDIFVLNSRTDDKGDMEGLPNAMLEAMAFEKPVVATRHAGIPMAIRDHETGLLVSEYQNDELYRALEELIIDEQLRLMLGKNARNEIVRRFTDSIMADSLVSIFQNLELRKS